MLSSDEGEGGEEFEGFESEELGKEENLDDGVSGRVRLEKL